jgi:hypothetical protein
MNEMKETGNEMRCSVQFRISRPKLDAYREAARSADLTLSAWLKMAANSYLSNWKDPTARRTARAKGEAATWPSGWPKDVPCWKKTLCGGANHDPAVHVGVAGVVEALRMLEDGWTLTP